MILNLSKTTLSTQPITGVINNIIIIIIILYKIYIAPYTICKKIALRRFTNNIKCKRVLHEPSTYTYLYMKYLDDVFMTNRLQEKYWFLPSSWMSKGCYTSWWLMEGCSMADTDLWAFSGSHLGHGYTSYDSFWESPIIFPPHKVRRQEGCAELSTTSKL